MVQVLTTLPLRKEEKRKMLLACWEEQKILNKRRKRISGQEVPLAIGKSCHVLVNPTNLENNLVF